MNTPHTVQETIRTPFPTRAARLQQARSLLEAAIGQYMRREEGDCSMGGPLSIREKVESTIFEICESLSGYADVREVLYLALEHPALALVVPSMFDPGVAPDYDDDVCAAFLLSEAYWDDLGRQLWDGWLANPVCCEVCGREPAAWRWVPDLLERPEDRWGIGQSCRAAIDGGHTLPYRWNSINGISRSTNLRPITPVDPTGQGEESPAPASGQEAAIAAIPAGYQSLVQREGHACEEVAAWFAQCLRSTRGNLPRPHTIKARLRRITTASIPQENEAIPLLLLALESGALAEEPPPDLVALLRKQEGRVTAAQLVRSNLSLHLLKMLGWVVREQFTLYWSGRTDGCEICQREHCEWIWYPFATRAQRFALPEQPRRDDPALRLGFACKAVLESGGRLLHFTHQDRLYHASRTAGVIPCPGPAACPVQPLSTPCQDGQI